MIRITADRIKATLAISLALTACGPSGGSPAAGSPPDAIVDTGMVTAQVGWVLAVPNGLALTHDGGGQWNLAVDSNGMKIAPASVDFQSPKIGWLLTLGPITPTGRPITVMRTTDGGQQWVRLTPFTLPRQEDIGSGSLLFTDLLHGWVVLSAISSPNFSLAYLFRTTDGGQTWAQVRAPFDGHIGFIDSLTGWVVGGLSGGELAVTHDGGSTWTVESVGTPHGAKDFGTSASLRIIGSTAVYARSTRNDAVNTVDVDFFVTQAPDFQWRHMGQQSRLSGGASVALIDAMQWVIAFGDSLTVTRDGGASWANPGKLPGGALSTFDFATTEVGLVAVNSVSCASFKSNCSRRAALFVTRDSGHTWLPTPIPN